MKYLRRTKSSTPRINNSSGQIGAIIFFLFLVFFCILIGRFITLQSPWLILGLVGGLAIALITLVNTDLALIILIFSMLLSPEIPIAHIPERAVAVRIDDILLVFMFFTWLAKIAINKQLGLLKKTPINWPLGIYILLCIVITALAILLRIGQAKFISAFFYILKYIEYLMLFFLVVNNLKSIRQCKKFSLFLLLIFFIVCIYGYIQWRAGVLRVSAPFEGEKSEPNTLAGYLIVIFGLLGGLFLHSKSARLKFLLGGLFLFGIPVFLFTLSRAGYAAFIAMYLGFIIFTKKKRLFLISLFLVLIVILPFVLPIEVTTRIRTTFIGRAQYEVLGKRLALDEASAARLEVWKYIFNAFSKSPLFGYGVTGLYFIDSQYGTILGELGIMGIIVFFWLIFRLFKSALKIYRESQDDYIQGLTLGFITAIIALLLMNWGTNAFIIVRIMEPFWFIAAMVLMAPQLLKSKEGIFGT